MFGIYLKPTEKQALTSFVRQVLTSYKKPTTRTELFTAIKQSLPGLGSREFNDAISTLQSQGIVTSLHDKTILSQPS